MKRALIAGMIILVSISPLFRGLYFDYETYAFLAALSLLLVLYFLCKTVENEPFHINKSFTIFGVLLVAAAAVSFVRAANARENLEYMLRYAGFLFVFFALYDYFHDKRHRFIPAVAGPVLLTGFACSAAGLMALADTSGIWNTTVSGSRIGSTFQYTNTASAYFAICLLFALALANSAKKLYIACLLAGMGNVTAFAFFQTGSRGGCIVGMAVVFLFLLLQPAGCRIKGLISFLCMLAPVFIIAKGFNASAARHDRLAAGAWLAAAFALAAVLSFLVLRYGILNRNKHITITAGSGFAIAAAVFSAAALAFVFRGRLISLLPPILADRLATLGLNDISVLYRLDFDRDALRLIAGSWPTGLGGGGWRALYQSVQDYFYTAVFVHNNYLQVFVDSGILGFLSYSALVAAGLVNAVRSYAGACGDIVKIRTAGLLCALFVLAVHSAFDFDLSFVSLALLLWTMFAAASAGQPAGEGAGAMSAAPSGGRSTAISVKRGTALNSGPVRVAAVAVCSVLFSFNAIYLAGAYNEAEALRQMQAGSYKAAMGYYEEASRLDPHNTEYTFELAKLYNYFAVGSADAESRSWLAKARTAGEKSVGGNRGYPAYINTLVQTYLASDMPLQALEYARRLAAYQRYNKRVYELLAESCIAAAGYYEKKGDGSRARELLEECIEIDRNPYLRSSDVDRPRRLAPEEEISGYRHSQRLQAYLIEAAGKIKDFQ